MDDRASQTADAPMPYFTCDGQAVARSALKQTELCAKSTAHDRFLSSVMAGVLLKLWQAGVQCFDEQQGIDWNWLSMDGAMTKAPLGGEKDGSQSHRPGQTGRQTQPLN